MKVTHIYFLITSLLFSCHSKDPITVTQIDSKEMVTILPSLKSPAIKDSIVISIPMEFQ